MPESRGWSRAFARRHLISDVFISSPHDHGCSGERTPFESALEHRYICMDPIPALTPLCQQRSLDYGTRNPEP